MPYQVDYTQDDDEPTKTVQITIECTPQCAEWIMALSAPLALNGHFIQSAVALPEALIMLGEMLEATDLPYVHWSEPSRELVEHFIASTRAYNKVRRFNYTEWLEQFFTEIDRLEEQFGKETDHAMFSVIRSVVTQIAEGQITSEQKALYCNSIGEPIDFAEWLDRVLHNNLAHWVVERAHLGAFDPERLKEMLNHWKDLSNASTERDDIPF